MRATVVGMRGDNVSTAEAKGCRPAGHAGGRGMMTLALIVGGIVALWVTAALISAVFEMLG
jgi:hypothetical protein